MSIEIFQCAAGRQSQAAGACSQFWADKSQPKVADHSHTRSQPRCWRSRIVLQKFFYIILYGCGKFFDRKRGHTYKTCARCILDLKTRKSPSGQSAGEPRRFTETRDNQRRKSCRASMSDAARREGLRDQSRPQIIATEVVRLPPMLKVRNFLTFSIWRAPACVVSC